MFISVSENAAMTIAINAQLVIFVSVSAIKWAMSGDVVIIIAISRDV